LRPCSFAIRLYFCGQL